jgi:hypothetical protein
MSAESTAGLGRWRDLKRTRSGADRNRISAKKWLGSSLLGALLVLAAGILAWILWQLILPAEIKPDFIALFISRFEDPRIPPIPQADADRDRIQQETFLSSADTQESQVEKLTLDVIKERLERLGKKERDDAVVFYLSTHAVVDDAGDLQLLTHDSDTYAPKTLLPLSTVIDALKQCPARKKLLVLDVMRAPGDPLELGATEDAAADLVSRELARPLKPGRTGDPSLAVLVPCSSGEVALWSEGLRQSVFGHFFVKGLGEPAADTNHDDAISPQELAKYVSEQVDVWSRQHRAMRQRPRLIGSTEDFPLASLNRRKPKPAAEAAKPAKNPESEAPADQTETSEAKAKAASEETKSDAKKQVEKKGKENKVEGQGGAAPPTTEPLYPPWLVRGWDLRERWAAGDEMALAPRLFRQLEAHLLRSERQWRLGKDVEKVEAALVKDIGDLTARMEQTLAEKRPLERSIGQSLAFGGTADGPLVKLLRDILERQRHPDPQASEDQRKAQKAEMIGALYKGLKDKKSLDLATAIFEAARPVRFDVDTVLLLDSIVSGAMLTPDGDVIELRLLRQLAERARSVRPDDWDDDLARKIWDTVVLAEQANNRPRSFRWVRGMLEDADALRHEAEIRLLPQAMAYTSPARLARCWEDVAQAYAAIDDLQTKIAEAQRTMVRARAVLPAYIPYETTATELGRSGPWLNAAKGAQGLDEELENSALDVASTPLTGERLKDLNRSLSGRTEQLTRQLDDLLGPFRTESVRRLIASCKQNVPEPRLGREVQALLSTPFLRPADRQELWKTSLELDRRLGELAPREGDSAVAVGSSDRAAVVREIAARRKEQLLALLKMTDPKATTKGVKTEDIPTARRHGGDQSETTEDQAPDEPLARSWGDLERFARAVHSRIADALRRGEREPGEDRPAWILPAPGLDENHNPIKLKRERESLAAWDWLASRYLHVYRDVQGRLDPDDKFFELASIECRRESGVSQEPMIRPSVPDGALRLSSQHTAIDVELQIVLEGNLGGAAERVTMAVLETDDPRLKVSRPQPEELDLAPATSTPVRLNVAWEESGADVPAAPPKGVIVRASLANGKAFHLLVPIDIVPVNAKPRLAIRVDPSVAADVPIDPLRLRTLPDKQPFFVVVRNPSPVDRRVIVDVMAGDQVIATSGDKDKPSLEVKSGSTATVGFGEPTGKPTDPLAEVPQGLSLRLRDAASGQEYYRQEMRPVIASPLEYIEVLKAQFVPPRPGEVNRLEVTLRSLPQMTGPACPIRLDIPSDPELFPAFVEPPRGNLEGTIEAGGKLLRLVAEDIKLKPIARDQGQFSLSVDGTAKALWYQTRFVLEGQAQKVEPVRQPRIRFQPELSVKPGQPARLTVRFQADNAPRDARLQFRLGHFEKGEFKDDIKHWTEQAKKRHIGFDPRGKGGAVLFEASVEDWIKEFDVPGIRGRRFLYAYLLDARQREELDRWGMELVLDDVAPRITLVEAPPEIESTETRLIARATVKPTESRIKEVSFIVNPGTKGDFAKAEIENKTVPGKPSSGDPDTWEAALQVPKGASGKLVVSARATSVVGLSSIAHCEVVIREPVPEPSKAAAKPAEEKPGAIEGKVTENDVAQPGLTVYLIDPNAKDKENPVKRSVKTTPDGTYSFPDLKPGPYRIFCPKVTTNRRDTKDVNVGSGQTVKQNLDLLLP